VADHQKFAVAVSIQSFAYFVHSEGLLFLANLCGVAGCSIYQVAREFAGSSDARQAKSFGALSGKILEQLCFLNVSCVILA
jgi:hypothetical protein